MGFKTHLSDFLKSCHAECRKFILLSYPGKTERGWIPASWIAYKAYVMAAIIV